jgi:hypothetical protein
MISLPQFVVLGLIWKAWQKAGEKGVMTEERKKVYLNALEYLTDPDKLRKLADAFESEGFKIEAAMLRKRADLRALPKEVKEKHRAILEKGLNSTNIPAILALAEQFDNLSATGSAEKLRNRVKELSAKQAEEQHPFDSPRAHSAPVENPKKDETKEESSDSEAPVEVITKSGDKLEVAAPAIHGEES